MLKKTPGIGMLVSKYEHKLVGLKTFFVDTQVKKMYFNVSTNPTKQKSRVTFIRNTTTAM